MNSNIAKSLIRQVLTVVGAGLAADLIRHGFSAAQAHNILGAAMVIVSVMWSWYTHQNAAPAILPVTPPPSAKQ